MIRNKAQAAMEFLMSYGWAILIVVVAIGSLAYFGVLNPAAFLPESCFLPVGITCSDFSVKSSRIILILQNNLAETITITDIDVTKKTTGNSCSNTESIMLENDQKAIFTILDCNNGDIGERFRADLDVTYTTTSLIHTAKGDLIVKITEEADISSYSVAKNAEDNGLCSGLDLVYGIGYQDLCCEEHGFCC